MPFNRVLRNSVHVNLFCYLISCKLSNTMRWRTTIIANTVIISSIERINSSVLSRLEEPEVENRFN